MWPLGLLFIIKLHHLLNDDMYFLHVLTLLDLKRNSHNFFAKIALYESSKEISVDLTMSSMFLSKLNSENRYIKGQ
jgi:hypothetical protein